MNIIIMGLGFVGLTTALGLADRGFSVTGYDVDEGRTETIAGGHIPFLEAGLSEALARTLGQTFHVAEKLDETIRDAAAVFICVGTPSGESGRADLRYVKDAIRKIAAHIGEDCLIVIKSTVPPGTTEHEIIPFVRSLGLTNGIAVNPEFLREGHSWQDFTMPDRIVCGVDGGGGVSTLHEIYAPFGAPLHFVTPSTAEFIKYLSNSLLATLISFSNEMAAIADAAGGVAIGEAFRILHEDGRLAGSGIAHYIYPGCGYGGYCLPKDTAALLESAVAAGFTPPLLREVIRVNEKMPQQTAEKILRLARTPAENIGILGLSFKPDSDDVRESPAAKIIAELNGRGYQNICAYDPAAAENFERTFSLHVNYCETAEDVLAACGVVAIVTAWPEFIGLNKKYPHVRFADCRYILETAE